jgi:hypothetical protein
MAMEEIHASGPKQLQLQQAVDTFRFQMGLLVQFWGFLIAADAVLVGYALSQRQAVLLLAASAMPIFMMLVARGIYLHGLPFLYVALRLERELMPREDSLTASYARMRFPHIYARVVAALDIEDVRKRDKAINNLKRHAIRPRSLVVLLTGYLAHLGLFFVALAGFHYRFM